MEGFGEETCRRGKAGKHRCKWGNIIKIDLQEIYLG
jgi:hypothetical protein